MNSYVEICGWTSSINWSAVVHWGWVLLADRTLAGRETPSLILEARGVPMGYCTCQKIETLIRTFGRPYISISMAGVWGPNMVVLEVEVLWRPPTATRR